MDPPSPSKNPMSPGMPIFPASPERGAGPISPLAYGGTAPQSPSLPDLRPKSPLRKHRRNDSDLSVHGLAAMFENLEVKDFKEAQAKYTLAMQKQKTKHAAEIRQMEKDYALGMNRRQVRIEELQAQLESVGKSHQGCTPKDVWDAARKEQRDAISKWESAMKRMEEKRGQMDGHIDKLNRTIDAYKAKCHTYKQSFEDARDRKDKLEKMLPNYQGKISGLERTIRRAESDLKFQTGEAEKYKNQVYGFQVDVEAARAQLGEEVETLKERLRLVEGERDALKTSLKEDEVLRIATEGQIPLPAATTEEQDEFGSPVRTRSQSPRKQRTPERDEDDKENVAPKKAVVELRLAQQELATEKRLRERAQDQIDFMKMECQFRCCSCRVADFQGSHFVHDNTYATEMERIKSSVPTLTPPPSSHGEDPMETVDIKQEPAEEERPPTPPAENSQLSEQDQTFDTTVIKRAYSKSPESMAFSPTTGTFRPSLEKGQVRIKSITQKPSFGEDMAKGTEVPVKSSPSTSNTHSTIMSTSRPQSRVEAIQESEATSFDIHEDVVMDSDEEETRPQTPVHDPTGPARPQYLTRTTTTTIPLHFSPATPAFKRGPQPMTPSTVGYAAADARTPVLGELSMNKLPFDREAALEAIRERRGRARSMAAGQGTPMKQMMEKDRRDISAPVSRVRR